MFESDETDGLDSTNAYETAESQAKDNVEDSDLFIRLVMLFVFLYIFWVLV